MRKMISWSKEALAEMALETLNAWLAILWAVGKIDESRG